MAKKVIDIEGSHFLVVNCAGGHQVSPLGDGSRETAHVMILNLDTEECIRVSNLQVQMIGRYGFYQGSKSAYRIAPDKIARLYAGILGQFSEWTA